MSRRVYPLLCEPIVPCVKARELLFGTVNIDVAIELVSLWHSRLPNVDTSNILRTVNRACYSAEFGGLFYAVAIWTNPVARLLPQRTWMELRRLAISGDAPKNTASRMIAWMAKDIARRHPEITTLISYQDTEVHRGTIYRASGWYPASVSSDGEWNRPNRFRNAAQSAAPKVRWQMEIKRKYKA